MIRINLKPSFDGPPPSFGRLPPSLALRAVGPRSRFSACRLCGHKRAPEPPESWFQIESTGLGFVFYHRGVLTRRTLANIISVLKHGLRKRELLKKP